MGIKYENHGYTRYIVYGQAAFPGFETVIPGDLSSAAFPIAAALATHSELMLRGVDMHDVQGDKQLIHTLIKMGAKIEIAHAANTLMIKKGNKLTGIWIDINDYIDAIAILAVIGCFAEGTTEIANASIARKKESDRIHAIVTELKKMGADIEEKEDGLTVHHSHLKGAHLKSYHDHRIAMSLAIAALKAEGPTIIEDVECVAKTYPTFVKDFNAIGADIKEIP